MIRVLVSSDHPMALIPVSERPFTGDIFLSSLNSLLYTRIEEPVDEKISSADIAMHFDVL